MSRPYSCPRCRSTNTAWKGYRQVQEGRVRLKRCRDCGRRFTSRIVVPREEPHG